MVFLVLVALSGIFSYLLYLFGDVKLVIYARRQGTLNQISDKSTVGIRDPFLRIKNLQDYIIERNPALKLTFSRLFFIELL